MASHTTSRIFVIGGTGAQGSRSSAPSNGPLKTAAKAPPLLKLAEDRRKGML